MRGLPGSLAERSRVRWAIVRLLPAGGPVLPALSIGAAAIAGLLPLAFVAATSVLVGEVRMADLIVVLGDGRIVESGTHDELVARGGAYAELFELQARAYR